MPAETASSAGMGAFHSSWPRSETTSRLYPSAMASEACTCMLSMALRSPAPPSATGKSAGSVMERNARLSGPPSSARMRSRSSSVRTGVGTSSWWQESGVGSRRLRSGPTAVSIPMMISSRMASTGGFVTWAKSCLK